VIDAMKSWKLAHSITKDFFPYLIPQQSLVLHQDFAHFFTPWIHLMMYRWRPYFTLNEVIPRSGSLVFSYVKVLPAAEINGELGFESFTENEIEAAFAFSLGLVTEEKKRHNIAAAHVMLYLHENLKDQARNLLKRYKSKNYSEQFDFK